ncbi:hypothetical protein KX729_10135 [Rhizobium sp. XQZ8]|uniref:hypothetical protein n=1 Tax=Rhizobium populisoli TaxID=2859785 RepID=UPI001CA49BD2|nr:hypothetical protein [Rhizobium populisoli]MBW6421801.1 hypothetical protein [Rhizobium populisoli]
MNSDGVTFLDSSGPDPFEDLIEEVCLGFVLNDIFDEDDFAAIGKDGGEFLVSGLEDIVGTVFRTIDYLDVLNRSPSAPISPACCAAPGTG